MFACWLVTLLLSATATAQVRHWLPTSQSQPEVRALGPVETLPRPTRGIEAGPTTLFLNDAAQPPYGGAAADTTSDLLRSFDQPTMAAASAAAVPDFPSQGLVPYPVDDHAERPVIPPIGTVSRQPDPWVEQTYDRVLDLVPDGNDRQLIERVREAETLTDVGVDTTAEDWVTVSGDATRISWGGRIEADSINWMNDEEFGGQQNYMEFRRLRLQAKGEGYGVYDYQLELEFAGTTDSPNDGFLGNDTGAVGLQDAYVGLRDTPWLGYVVLGNFRVPIGLSNNTSTRFETFLERSLPTRLLPGREVGVAAYNRSSIYATTWSYGAFYYGFDQFSHDIVDDNQGVRFVGRSTWTPVYDETTGGRRVFHTGLGYAFTRPRLRDVLFFPGQTNRPVRFATRAEINEGDQLIDTGTLDVDSYHTLNGELACVRGPLSIQSELSWSNLDQVGVGDTELYGTYIQASYFLTGEHRPYDPNFAVFQRVIPYENFWVVRAPRGTKAGWGAWEVACRWSYLSFSEINGQRQSDITTGLNWYWNPHTRLMMNWVHAYAHASPIVGAELDAQGDVLAMRFQVDF